MSALIVTAINVAVITAGGRLLGGIVTVLLPEDIVLLVVTSVVAAAHLWGVNVVVVDLPVAEALAGQTGNGKDGFFLFLFFLCVFVLFC